MSGAAAGGLGPRDGQRLSGFCPVSGRGGSMLVAVCVLVLLDRVVACSATARETEPSTAVLYWF